MESCCCSAARRAGRVRQERSRRYAQRVQDIKATSRQGRREGSEAGFGEEAGRGRPSRKQDGDEVSEGTARWARAARQTAKLSATSCLEVVSDG
jgi:hypothetical protein